MNIYFSCSITGGRRDQADYAALVDYLLREGHTVPTAHLASAGVLDEEQIIDAQEVYQRDTRWVEECDALIAEVSTPSHGVGYEIALAAALGKPALCVHRDGRKVSKMLTGNPHVTVRSYTDTKGLIRATEAFLADLEEQR